MDKKPNLAMAYNVKSRNRKKMVTAKTEARPMPSEVDQDSAMVSRNDSKKPMPKPKTQALARGGMVSSPVIKTSRIDSLGQKLDNQEDMIMSSMPPEDETEHIAYDDDHAIHSKMMAKGGPVDAPHAMESRPDKGWGAIIVRDKDDSDMDESMMAEGGEVEMDHADSIAAAIMAREDERKMLAEGGQVDIDMNAEEQANQMDSLNEAALKENYDSDMDDVSQPMDSNEMGHEIDSDEHDMISKIRSQMNRQRQFKVR